MKPVPSLTLLGLLGFLTLSAPAQHLLLEAEQFADAGGWDLDQQAMEVMGSPYLLAHGLGVPVRDAVTTAKFPSPGTYRVWVRTRDWVAPWKAPGTPGRFQVLVNGKPLAETFGTKGEEWHWQDGGRVEVGEKAQIALHDLTGFEGRCDAVLFSQDPAFTAPNELAALTRFRRLALGLPEEPEDGGEFDLVVVGGGIAGTSAALSAARNGLRVALVQDRPVLGGNGSSEVRVWPEGNTRQKPYPHIGEIVEELVSAKHPGAGNARHGGIYDDQRKLNLVRAEPRITLLTEQRVYAVAARDGRIQSVDAQQIRTAARVRLRAKFFADCTGDATAGFLAGADYEYSRDEHQGASNLWNLMDASDPAQVLKCECKDKDALAISVKEGNVAAAFPRCPWAVDLTGKPFPGRKNFKGQWANTPLSNLGGWFWETGFQLDMVNDIERIRDQNFRAMYGAWDALKNVDKLYPNHRLGWAAFIAGKRESRRLLGDVVLTADDFRKGRDFTDGAFPCSWHIDIHTPHPSFDKGHTGNEFISQATTGEGFAYKSPYWAPYRTLYSRNITNLFMAGRDISVTRDGLGPVRVMKTCGMMGEIVGKAAWICVRHQTTPRGVYEKHLPLLKELMAQPGAMRRDTLHGPLALPVHAATSPADGPLNVARLRNPVWTSADNLRDPSVLKVPDGYLLFYSRLAGTNWASPASWTIACAFTRDFVHFENDRNVPSEGHASPGDVVKWHGRYLLPYQAYPATPTWLCFSESPDLQAWSAPKPFLNEARFLPWNTLKRVIDPTLVLDGETLHCYFIGSANFTNAAGKTLRANLLGHALTHDPKLDQWEILSTNAPLLGVSKRAPDGVENVMIFRTGDHWTMICSEGLANQHLALATSTDLCSWTLGRPIELPRQKWMARKHGAPFVWREANQWMMILMGESAAGRTTFGLLTSPDGKRWTLLPELP